MRKTLLGTLMLGAAYLLIAAPANASTLEIDTSGAPGSDCVVVLHPENEEGTALPAEFLGCFASPLAGDAAANAALGDETYPRGGAVTIGYDYPYANYSTLQANSKPIRWVVPYPCSQVHRYAVPSIGASEGSGWNDSISSAYATKPGNCANFNHFEHNNYGGAKISCRIGAANSGCQTMGYMADKTSSLRFRP
jgi:hypothetical protein